MRLFLFFILTFTFYYSFADFSRDLIYIHRCYDVDEGDTTMYTPSIKYHNTYNNNNLLIESIVQTLSSGVWTDSTKETMTLDPAGRIIRKLRENWISGAWQNSRLDSSLYNSFGSQILYSSYQWASGWKPYGARYSYSFSASDSLLTFLSQNPNGPVWINDRIIKHVRDIAQKDSIVLTQTWNGIAWINLSQAIHFRNAFGTDTIVLTQSWNGSWNDSQRHFYSIDSQQRVLTDSLQVYNGNWSTSSLIVYSYAQYGYNYNYTTMHWSSSDSIFYLDESFYYTIDLHHRVIGIRRDYEWTPNTDFIASCYFTYDTLGNLTSIYSWCNGCSGRGSYYFYNSYGNLIKSVEWSYNHRGGDLIQTACEYFYTSISSNTYICDSGNTILSVDSASNYLWSNGETTRQISVHSEGYYQAQLTYSDGMILMTPPVYVKILSSHPATHSTDSTVTLCQLNYISLSIDPELYTTYQWIRNDSVLAYQTIPSLYFYNSPLYMIPGDYQLIVTNPCGIDTSSITTLKLGQISAASITGPNSACDGDTAILTASPFGDYQYEWTHWPGFNSALPSINITDGGTYYLKVTDTAGCYSETSKYVPFKYHLISPIIIQDGNIIKVINNSNYNLQWYFNGVSIIGATTTNYTPILTGDYTVTFNSLDYCESISAVFHFLKNGFIAEAGGPSQVCVGSGIVLGMGTNTAYGGVPPYTFNWTPTSSLTSPNSSSPIAHPSINTMYHLKVTDSTGAMAFDSVFVKVDSLPSATIISSTGYFDYCENRITLFSALPVQNNRWQWKINGSIFSYSNYVSIYVPGVYKLIVITPNGCSDSSSVSTNELQNPVSPQIFVTGQAVACGGTGVALYVHNDTSLTYQWFVEYGQAILGETDTIFYPTQSDFYVIKVIAANHCWSTAQSPFIQPDSTFILQPIIVSDSNFCTAEIIDLYAQQVTGFSYQWYWNGFDIPGATTNHYQSTWPGYYSIRCIDSHGCIGGSSKEVYDLHPPDSLHIVKYGSDLLAKGLRYSLQWYLNGNAIPLATDTIYHPLQPGIYQVKHILNSTGGTCETMSDSFEVFCSVTLSQTNVPCNHSCIGEAEVRIISGAQPHITWSTGSMDSSISQLCEGPYLVSVTDTAGCDIVDSIIIKQINPVKLSTYQGAVSCNNKCDGSISNYATGGSEIYSWKINSVDTNANNFSNLCPGVYLIQVFDNAGCSDSTTITITNPPPIIISQQSLILPTCSGKCDGALKVSVTGAVGNYYFDWHDGYDEDVHSPLCDTVYILTVTDDHGCMTTDTFSITASIELQNSFNVLSPMCTNTCDGQLSISTINGTPPYNYSWSNGQTGANISACSGTISVTTNDSAGCRLYKSLYMSPQDSIYFMATNRATNCIGCVDGEIYLVPMAGTPPYTYNWHPTIGILSHDTISKLASGKYYVCITDNNSCGFCDSVMVPEDPTQVQYNLFSNSVSISPNPFHEYAVVRLQEMRNKKFKIIIKDVSGRVVEEFDNFFETARINGSNLSEGFYFISIISNGELQWIGKIVKE